MNEYLKCAEIGDINGMKQAKLDGIDVHAVNPWGFNAYMIASQYSHFDCMKQIKRDGVDIHAVDKCDKNAYLINAHNREWYVK